MERHFPARIHQVRHCFRLLLLSPDWIHRALLKLVLLQRTKRPIVSPPIPERDIDPATLPSLDDSQPQSSPLKLATLALKSPDEESEQNGSRQTPSHLSNNRVPFNPTGKPHPLLSSLSSTPLTQTVIEDYLLPKALTPALVRPPVALLHPIKGLARWTSEIIYILQPLLYISMLRPTASNQNVVKGQLSTSVNSNNSVVVNPFRSPFAIAVILSLLSRWLRRQPPTSPSTSNSLERQEYARRDRELLWYFFRGEAWTHWTRPRLENLSASLEGRPLLGLLSSVIQGWASLVDEYWYCE